MVKLGSRGLVRAVALVAAAAVMVSPLLLAASSEAAKASHYRKSLAPNVVYPLAKAKADKDLNTFRGLHHTGTDINASCGQSVYAAHAGTLQVFGNVKWSGKYFARIVTNGSTGLFTNYGHLASITAKPGQVIAAGQKIGTVGKGGNAKRCELFFGVHNYGKLYNPSGWLNMYVGKPAPISKMWGTAGITVASFNNLGASHTKVGSGSRYPVYTKRTPEAVTLLDSHNVDVVGMQEFQEPQADLFIKDSKGRYGIYYWTKGSKRDTENSIIWRNSTMQLVSATTYDVKYFNGNTRHMPVVLLRQRSSGREAYFLNTHNPASNVFGYGNQSKYRTADIAIERALIAKLRATGLPVFITGDFNDRKPAFCGMTAQMLTISMNSTPSMTCTYPTSPSTIDWVFAAGPARFTSFVYDKSSKVKKISDHPMVVTRVFLGAAGS